MIDKYHLRHQRNLLLTRLLNSFKLKNRNQLMNIKSMLEKYIQNFSDQLKMGRGMVWISVDEDPKTNLSFFISNCLSDFGFRCHYEANLNFLDYLISNSDVLLEERYPDLGSSDLLIIDGLEEKDDALSLEKKEALYQLLFRRLILNLPILFLTRFSIMDIKKIYGQKVSDHLFDKKNMLIHFDFPKA